MVADGIVEVGGLIAEIDLDVFAFQIRVLIQVGRIRGRREVVGGQAVEAKDTFDLVGFDNAAQEPGECRGVEPEVGEGAFVGGRVFEFQVELGAVGVLKLEGKLNYTGRRGGLACAFGSKRKLYKFEMFGVQGGADGVRCERRYLVNRLFGGRVCVL